MAVVTTNNTKPSPSGKKTFRWYLGLMIASVFSMVYFVGPFYMITALIAVVFQFPSLFWALVFASPIIISAVLPPICSPFILRNMSPIFDYFDYEEIIETKPIDVRKEILENGKNYIGVYQPHGTLSYAGMLYGCNLPEEFLGKVPTAVADAVLYTPLVKHLIGIFGIISASKASLQKTLRKKGPEGNVVLYVGGIAELFLSSLEQERLYLLKRKGFIKLALQEGVDVLPCYMFGNTTVLSVMKNELLASISRKYQVSLTYIWGKWGLPIPRDCKILVVSGQPLGMPHIPKPTQEDIDKWHAKYCQEVTRLFDTYKERVPEYKHKKLEIL